MLTLRILSPEAAVYEGGARQVSFPGRMAPFDVYPQHAPMISSLPIKSGIVKIQSDLVQACVVPQR